MAAKRRDGFASDGSSSPVLVLCSLSQFDSLRNVSTNFCSFFFHCQYRVNPLIPPSNILYLSAIDAFTGFDDFNHPFITVGLLLSLTTRLLRRSPGVSLLWVHRTQFPSHFLVSFPRLGDSIMQLLQGGGSHPTRYIHVSPRPSTTKIERRGG